VTNNLPDLYDVNMTDPCGQEWNWNCDSSCDAVEAKLGTSPLLEGPRTEYSIIDTVPVFYVAAFGIADRHASIWKRRRAAVGPIRTFGVVTQYCRKRSVMAAPSGIPPASAN
jgi:hypothetical protein